VRERSKAEGRRILNEIELNKIASWSVQKRENGASASKGYVFQIRLLNELGGPDLMELNLYAPSEEGALDIQKRFLERPLDIIRKVMTMFTTDMSRL
jgi:hypothetical protein